MLKYTLAALLLSTVALADDAEPTPEQQKLIQLAAFYDRATIAFTRQGDPQDALVAQQIHDNVVKQLQPAAAQAPAPKH